jgi:hypothetical protein
MTVEYHKHSYWLEDKQEGWTAQDTVGTLSFGRRESRNFTGVDTVGATTYFHLKGSS